MHRSATAQTSATFDRRGLARSLGRRLESTVLPAAGLFVGMGLAGAVIDGLMIQKALGWHPLTQNPLAMERAASLFFVATLAMLLVGLDLLFRIPPQTRWAARRPIAAWTLIGAGLFQVLVGLGDHHLAAVRHLRPEATSVALWDLAYLALGFVLALGGLALLRGRRPSRSLP